MKRRTFVNSSELPLRMYRYEFGKDLVVVGLRPKETLEDIDPFSTMVYGMKYSIMKRNLFAHIYYAYGRAHDLEGCTIVRAHGLKRPKRTWKYADGKNRNSVQDLVDHFDGKSAAILLYMCNPHDFSITAQKSLVIHTRISWNELMLFKRQCPMRLFVPNVGYVEHSNALMRKTLDDLMQKKPFMHLV